MKLSLPILAGGLLLALCAMGALVAGGAAWYLTQDANPAPYPGPCPGPGPCPLPTRPKPRSPWGEGLYAPVGASESRLPGPPAPWPAPRRGASVGGPVAPNGEEIHCDLPGRLHQRNTGGSDGAGLCVYASARHAGLHQNNEAFAGIFDWMRKHPGGSYPEKFDRTMAMFCKERGLPKPAYIQVQGRDLEILKLACRTGRMPGVTYGYSPTGRYGGARIAHMVSLPHASDHFFAVLDNNYVTPADQAYEWLTPEEFVKTYTTGGSGWSVILLDPAPPPTPTN